MSNFVHLINDNGEKKVVDSKCLNESVNDNFHIDVEWYLSNGYSKAEDMFKEIEGEYNHRKEHQELAERYANVKLDRIPPRSEWYTVEELRAELHKEIIELYSKDGNTILG